MQANMTSDKKQEPPFVITLEGNIGSGKTSLLSQCEQDQLLDVVYEPVESWTNLQGSNLLAKFYENPKEWGMTLQSYITLTMLKNHRLKSTKPMKIMERSLNSARHCFIRSMVSSGSLQPLMRDVLDEWYDFIDIQFKDEVKVDLIVYLDITPEISHQRMTERGRGAEATVPLEYLQQLEKLHVEWLQPMYRRFQDTGEGTPVYVLDASQPIKKIWEDLYSYLGMWRLELGLEPADPSSP